MATLVGTGSRRIPGPVARGQEPDRCDATGPFGGTTGRPTWSGIGPAPAGQPTPEERTAVDDESTRAEAVGSKRNATTDRPHLRPPGRASAPGGGVLSVRGRVSGSARRMAAAVALCNQAEWPTASRTRCASARWPSSRWGRPASPDGRNQSRVKWRRSRRWDPPVVRRYRRFRAGTGAPPVRGGPASTCRDGPRATGDIPGNASWSGTRHRVAEDPHARSVDSSLPQ